MFVCFDKSEDGLVCLFKVMKWTFRVINLTWIGYLWKHSNKTRLSGHKNRQKESNSSIVAWSPILWRRGEQPSGHWLWACFGRSSERLGARISCQPNTELSQKPTAKKGPLQLNNNVLWNMQPTPKILNYRTKYEQSHFISINTHEFRIWSSLEAHLKLSWNSWNSLEAFLIRAIAHFRDHFQRCALIW